MYDERMDRNVKVSEGGANEDALQCARSDFLHPLCTTLFLFFGIMIIFPFFRRTSRSLCLFHSSAEVTVQYSTMIRGLVSNGSFRLGHRSKIGRSVTYLLRVHIIFFLF